MLSSTIISSIKVANRIKRDIVKHQGKLPGKGVPYANPELREVLSRTLLSISDFWH